MYLNTQEWLLVPLFIVLIDRALHWSYSVSFLDAPAPQRCEHAYAELDESDRRALWELQLLHQRVL
jgi:hypothetical protein